MSDTPKLRWYQFSLRTLMVAAAVVALAATWWNHRNYCLTRAREHDLSTLPILTSPARAFRSVPREETMRLERHRRMAGEYRRAVWLPWERLWIDDREKAP